ncbi:MAG: carbohydrate binding family 9 domain-containing protein [Acidobacteria bacterium]|nr:carbohydrate binding family 9 domain-containing protein [Acidobacteriota bacterium]
MKAFCTLFLCLLVSFCAVFGQNGSGGKVQSEKSLPVTIPKFEAPPTIDGRLDDEIWKKAAVFDNFIQIQPGDNIAPSKETIVYVGYDEKNLYVGFHAFDDPNLIRATIANRDDVSADDNVRVTLDTFNDQRRAYVFFFNPFGIQADSVLTDAQGSGPDFSVDVVMESKGVLLDDGYSVEVKIPFKSLRYTAGKGRSWGFNVGRRIPRMNNENDSWMPISRDISSLRQIGKITGLDEIEHERTLEIVPSITLSEAGERIEDASRPQGSRFLNNPVKKDIGVSLKYQITPNITLDAAVNPDFAEVEADAPVVLANERFPIFFPEKRPFFLEGIDYFRTPLQVVNTRNIADPDAALKLTGKTGRNTFGLLSAVDRFPETNTKAYVGVMRLKRDFGVQSNIGLIATTYHFGARKHNNLFGVDAKFQLTPQKIFDFQVVGTNSRRNYYNPNTDAVEYRTGNGIAYQANYDYTGKNRGYRFGINGRSKDYRADVGFTRRTNTHAVTGGWRIGTEPDPKKTLIGLTTRTFFNFSVDERGRLQQLRSSFNTDWNFQKELSISTGTDFEVSKIYEDEFGARRNSRQQGIFYGENFRKANQFTTDAEIEKTFNEKISINAGFGITTNAFDFDFGASERYPRVSPAALAGSSKLDPGRGLSFQYSVGLGLQPTEPWNIELSYEREKLKRNDTKLTAFDSNIYSLRSTYQFTRFIFARVRTDYETIDGTINSQLLLGWSPNPGTAFYVGYNDNSSYRAFNEFRERFDDGFRRDGRRFFIRISYLFRKSV